MSSSANFIKAILVQGIQVILIRPLRTERFHQKEKLQCANPVRATAAVTKGHDQGKSGGKGLFQPTLPGNSQD